MVKVIPSIIVKNAKQTLAVYEDLFGAKTLSRMPFNPELASQTGLPEGFDFENSTMHAEFKIGDALFYINDFVQTEPPSEGKVEIVLELDSKEQIDAIWKKVKQKNYKIRAELEKTFWNAYFGMFVDDDGIGWQLNFPMPPPAEPVVSPDPAKKALKAAKPAKPAKARKK
jgi:PhnB protein